ncbi:MAG: VWA domain-containing protein [Planctomycetota bacterium]|nr:VWA domain-containing protein [Planctomycetota bacterium]
MVDGTTYALYAAGITLFSAVCAEWLHAARVERVARLAFGASAKPAWWARSAPTLRVLAAGSLAWGLVLLFFLPPTRHDRNAGASSSVTDPKHVLVVLDVSPSMRLVDAGPKHDLSRMQRAREVLFSFFERVPFEQYRVSIVAVYNGAKAVVVDTRDFEVVRNILGELPMHFAFKSGKTKLFDGLTEAAKIAAPWNPDSTTLVVVSDGDTVPATGMPTMPESVHATVVIGVGDSKAGKFIDGANSRQDVMMLRQIATRLGGSFHDANEAHLPTSLIGSAFELEGESPLRRLTVREYALIAVGTGALVLALLPLLLHFCGLPRKRARISAAKQPNSRGAQLASAGEIG